MTWLATAMAMLSCLAGMATADVPTPPVATNETAGAPINTDIKAITGEAQKERKEIEREARSFVSHIAVAPFEESLMRWKVPVCPLVEGLPREQGEFMLAHLSQIITAAGAPLAQENCKPNLYIVVSPTPMLCSRSGASVINICSAISTSLPAVSS